MPPTDSTGLRARHRWLGGWRDAFRIGCLTAATATGLGLVFSFAILPTNSYLTERFGTSIDVVDRTRIGLGLATQIFGVDVHATGGNSDLDVMAFDLGAGMIPTTLLLIVLAVAIRTFRRRTARLESAMDAIDVAARSGLVTGAVMVGVAALVGRRVDGVVAIDDSLGISSGLGQFRLGPHLFSAFLHPALTLLVVLGATCLVRRDWMNSDLARTAHDWLAAPLHAVYVGMCLLPPLGLVTVLAVLATSGDPGSVDLQEWRAYTFSGIAWGGNLGVWALTLGLWGRVGATWSLPDDLEFLTDGQTSHWAHLPTVADTWFDDAWGLWIVVILAPLVLVSMVRTLVRRSLPAHAEVNLVILTASMMVVVPGLVRVANLHAGGTATVAMYGDWEASADAGAGAWGATAMTVVYLSVISAFAWLAHRRAVHPSRPQAEPVSGPSTPGSPPESGAEPPTG